MQSSLSGHTRVVVLSTEASVAPVTVLKMSVNKEEIVEVKILPPEPSSSQPSAFGPCASVQPSAQQPYFVNLQSIIPGLMVDEVQSESPEPSTSFEQFEMGPCASTMFTRLAKDAIKRKNYVRKQ